MLLKELQTACSAGSGQQGLPFDAFMERCLYHPDWGYYASGNARIGRMGDFFTSVSVGPCFGMLLAHRIAQHWQEAGRPPSWTIVEQGAHDGQLAADILQASARDHPDFFSTLRYTLVEPFSVCQARQETTLSQWAERTHWSPDLSSLPPSPHATYLANELLDAFPVHRIRRRGHTWKQMHVCTSTPAEQTATRNALCWSEADITDPALAAAVDTLPALAWADGTTTEICTETGKWAEILATALPQARLLLIDYGFEELDYYHPSRSDGTLRTYHQHRAHDDPLIGVGHSDITAHVDFTAVIRQLENLGFACDALVDQGRYLTRMARPWLLSMEKQGPPRPENAALLRQFTTLTHPAHMGRSFLILEARPA